MRYYEIIRQEYDTCGNCGSRTVDYVMSIDEQSALSGFEQKAFIRYIAREIIFRRK